MRSITAPKRRDRTLSKAAVANETAKLARARRSKLPESADRDPPAPVQDATVPAPQASAKLASSDIDTNLRPLARGPAAALPADLLSSACAVQLNAVKGKLSQAVGIQPAAQSARRLDEPPNLFQASLLECVTALEQLEATLSVELARSEQLEQEIFAARVALAHARAELLDGQAGERRARHLALHDSLTGLPNRVLFQQRLDHALARALQLDQPLAVLYLDLDDFKSINDAHGHQVGDELLKVVAARLARAVRAEDTVSRLGGDEFACLVADMPPRREHLSRLACKVFDGLSAPLKIRTSCFTLRASIGIARCPTDGTNAQALIENADGAMYRARRNQTAFEFFDASVDG